MRDEIKSATFCLALVLLPVFLFVVYHPEIWTSAKQAIPLPPPLRLVSDPLPPAQFDDFVARYGPPTFEEQSAQGVLQPPLFTKWLDYEPENLRVAFVAAEDPSGGTDGLPGRRWILISFVDAKKTRPVSAEEAARRLSSRQR
jgi:hypothetical protein